MIQFERRGIQIIDFILFIMFCLFCIISYMTSNSSYFFVGDVFLTIMVFIDIDIIKIKKIHKLNDEQLREINYMLTKKRKFLIIRKIGKYTNLGYGKSQVIYKQLVVEERKGSDANFKNTSGF